MYKMLVNSDNRTRISLFILGFTSIITQIILLRDFLSVYNGNELVTGMILANWMLLTGLGSFFGRVFEKQINNSNFIFLGHLLSGLLPLLISFLIYYLRYSLYPPGKIINLAGIFFNSFFLLTPYCLITGFMFPMLATALSNISNLNVINKAYAMEALGSLAGGLLFNFVMIFVLESYLSLAVVMMLNFTAAIAGFYFSGKKVFAYIISLVTVILTLLIVFSNLEIKALSFIFPNQEIVHAEDTPYSKIVVTRTDDQFNFYENGNFLFSGDNVIMNEENVHYAMVQHPLPLNVLLISGGISGSIPEIMKYKIASLDYVEQNPELIEIGRSFTSNIVDDPRVHIINQDARLYIKTNNQKKYDVVLVNLPDPSSAQINRFYTLEFFQELKRDLTESGVICISLSATSNYMGEQSRKINSSVYLTLKLMFQNVIIIPGGLNYFIASDLPVSRSINELLGLKKINNTYLNSYYIDDKKIERESLLIEKVISQSVAINYDFKPVVYLYQLDYWLSHFNVNYLLLFVLLFFPMTYTFLNMNFINTGIFVTGFSASAIEIILIIAFQVIYGYTYQMMGILITFFMAGILIGSVFMIDRVKIFIRNYSIIQYMIGIFSIVVALVLFYIKSANISNLLVYVIFVSLVIITGILTGLQFSMASRLKEVPYSRNASSTYASDLFGAAIGAIAVSAFLIPFFGIIKVSLIIAILNFITGLYILLKLRSK